MTPPRGKETKSKPAKLYNLSDDPGESNNIIKEHPELAKSMEDKLKELITGPGIRQN